MCESMPQAIGSRPADLEARGRFRSDIARRRLARLLREAGPFHFGGATGDDDALVMDDSGVMTLR